MLVKKSVLSFYIATSIGITGTLLHPANAKDVFTLDVTVDGVNKIFGFSNAETFVRQNEGTELEKVFDNYTENSRVDSKLDFRGLPAFATFNQNSSTLRVQIPNLDIDLSFTGANRDEAVDTFVDYLQDNQDDLLARIQRELVQSSAVETVAGNPNSLQGNIISRAYSTTTPIGAGTTTTVGRNKNGILDAATLQSLRKGTENYILFGLAYENIDAGGVSGYQISLPVGYSVGFDAHPGYRLNIEMPLTFTDYDGAKAYQVAFTTNLQIPVSDQWYLYPSLSYGIAGSEDLASLGHMVSGGIASAYTVPLHNMSVTIGNALGYSKSLDLSVDEYEFNPDVSSTYLVNGLTFNIPLGNRSNGAGIITAGYNYTKLFGSNLYLEDYHRVELDYITTVIGANTNLGAHYTFGDDYKVFGLKAKIAF